ncbi:hypothetical protein GCM10007415_34180 [Parapedobacter pyrenivorans]|uniref:DUF4397 domain-containing protein n=2 Tax=Parapedobacter pyrenivorans TaxID=1305674 RepID=A0A917HYB6_9SPHI|nr:hypothetical protein GCM10007415_34180 [Parapedobacter pyrenivorans]
MTMNIKLRKTPKLLLFASAALLALTVSCEKDDNDTPNPPTGSGKVALLNAAFGSDSVNFFVGTKKATSKLLGYGDSLKYLDVAAGEPTFELKGKDDKSIVKKSFKTEKDKSYSILASNSKDGKTFELIQVTDDLTAPKTDKAKIRFIHLSPDAGKLNLANGNTKLAENVTYKSASAYKEVDAKKTSFNIVDPEAKKTLLTVKDLELVKGKIYTIWVAGLEETGDAKKKLKAHIFTNN